MDAGGAGLHQRLERHHGSRRLRLAADRQGPAPRPRPRERPADGDRLPDREGVALRDRGPRVPRRGPHPVLGGLLRRRRAAPAQGRFAPAVLRRRPPALLRRRRRRRRRGVLLADAFHCPRSPGRAQDGGRGAGRGPAHRKGPARRQAAPGAPGLAPHRGRPRDHRQAGRRGAARARPGAGRKDDAARGARAGSQPLQPGQRRRLGRGVSRPPRLDERQQGCRGVPPASTTGATTPRRGSSRSAAYARTR